MNRTHLAIALAVAASACQRAATPPRVVTIVAREYALDVPDTLPAGLTTFQLRNDGKEPHEANFVRLDSGKTGADLLASFAPGPDPAWQYWVGGPGATFPGSAAPTTVAVYLAPGHYVVMCGVPGPDGKPHAMSGMLKDVIVTGGPATGGAAERTPPPSAAGDVAVTLVDYDFQFSTPLTAGTHTLAVTNKATQGHHMVLVRLVPGKSITDLLAWAHDQANHTSPVEWGTGAAYMSPGATAYVTANFTPGTYAVICVIPDVHDGKPHVLHGMQKQFTIS
jgi:hypothetical protein